MKSGIGGGYRDEGGGSVIKRAYEEMCEGSKVHKFRDNVCETECKYIYGWSVISLYAPGMETTGDERDTFWDELERCTEACEDERRILVIENMNVSI